jgi:hypothetical protein
MTTEVDARRQRDSRYVPRRFTGTLPPIVAPVPEIRRSILGASGAVRVPPPEGPTGRPDGDYEKDAQGRWWYLPDDPVQYRGYAAAERAQELTHSVGSALLDAESSVRRLERMLAVLDEERS